MIVESGEIIEAEDISIILNSIPSYDEIKYKLLTKYKIDPVALSESIKLSEKYKCHVVLIDKNAQNDLRFMQTEAIQSIEEIGAIVYWIMFKHYVSGNVCCVISILDSIVPCENVAYDPYKSFDPNVESVINAIYETTSGHYQGFTILHSHPTDSFVSCYDMKTKTYADMEDSLELYDIWKKYLRFTDITKEDIKKLYRLYTFLPDVLVMGGISHECVLYNSYGYTPNMLVLLYYDFENKYAGRWLNLRDYLENMISNRICVKTYKILYDHYTSKCYCPFIFTGFSMLEQKRVNDKVFYTITRL